MQKRVVVRLTVHQTVSPNTVKLLGLVGNFFYLKMISHYELMGRGDETGVHGKKKSPETLDEI